VSSVKYKLNLLIFIQKRLRLNQLTRDGFREIVTFSQMLVINVLDLFHRFFFSY
jgi:hypothetical protein